MNKKRPINLDLGSLHFPPMAIASILHRVSGVILFLFLPLLLWMFSQSLHSVESFDQLQLNLARPIYKFILWAFSAALIYHLLAGIRHLMMDIGFGEHLRSGRNSAIFVIALTTVLVIFLGIWIW